MLLCSCGSASQPPTSPSGLASAPSHAAPLEAAPPAAVGAAPASAASPAAPAPAATAPTEADRFADCVQMVALSTKLEGRYLWGGFDGAQQMRETLLHKATEYDALGLVHPRVMQAREAYSAAYRSSANEIAAAIEAESAPDADLPALQVRVLALLNPDAPRLELVKACEGVEAPERGTRRVTCAQLARAAYTSVRFAVFGTDAQSVPAIEELERRAAELGPDGSAFARAQRGRHDALTQAAKRWKDAPADQRDAEQARRASLLLSAVAETSKQLRALCPGAP